MDMKVRHIIICIIILSFLVPSLASAGSTETTYKPGDTISVRYPSSGNMIVVLEKPKFVRWTLFDPDGNNMYEEDHQFTYRKEIVFWGIAWEVYDSYQIRVPAFSKAGEWKLSGRVFSEALWIIEDPALIPYEFKFQVKEVSFFENLLAPFYFSQDMGFFAGRVSFSLPFHPYLILIMIGLLVAVILIMRFIVNIATRNGGPKNENKREK